MSEKPKQKNIKWESFIANWTAKLDELKCELLKSGHADEDVKHIRDIILKEFFEHDEDVPSTDQTPIFFMTHYHEFAKSRSSKRTQEIYMATASRMREFDKNIDGMHFEDVTVAWLGFPNGDDFISPNKGNPITRYQKPISASSTKKEAQIIKRMDKNCFRRFLGVNIEI